MMAKPTVLQTLLGRPSQSYTFPQDKNYYSTKAHMIRVAAEGTAEGKTGEQVVTAPTTVMGINDAFQSHVINNSAENSDDDVFYTPDSSPRVPMPSSSPPSEASIATTPLTSLDSQSIFSLQSSASTRITTQNSSETDLDSFTKSSRPRRTRNPTSSPSMTYTDEDWAKDVRWLAPPLTSKKKKSNSSYYVAQLPPKIIPQPPPPPPTRTRPKPRSRSSSKTSPSIMMTLEEEDEDRESIHRSSQTSERPRTNSFKRITRQHHLARRKSRSLEDLQLTVVPSYTPSIPSSGTPGFTSLTLPRAPQPAFTPNPSQRLSVIGGTDGKVDLTRSGIAQTTMATVEVTRGLVGSSKSIGSSLGSVFGFGFLNRRNRAAKVVGTGATAPEPSSGPASGFRSRKAATAGIDAVLSFTSYRKPPDYIPGGSVLIQVWAVGVDGVDARLAGVVHSQRTGPGSGTWTTAHGRSASESYDVSLSSSHSRSGLFRTVSVRSKSESSCKVGIEPDLGYIPGRSFVGRVLECGWEVNEEVVKKGEWVVGLLDVKKSGALQEFILVDRRRVHRIPQPVIPSASILSDSEPLPSSSKLITPPSASARGTALRGMNTISRPGRPPNLHLINNNSNPNPPPPPPPPLTIEECALLPLVGVFAYRAVRTLAYAFGKSTPALLTPTPTTPMASSVEPKYIHESQAGGGVAGGGSGVGSGSGSGARVGRVLVLRGHDGVGAMATQMLVKRGWRVCVHASLPCDLDELGEEEGAMEERRFMEGVERRVRRWGAEEVVFDDGYGGGGDSEEGGTWNGEEGVPAILRVIERLVSEGDVFDAVLDTVGGKEIWEASERLLRNVGPVSMEDEPICSPSTTSLISTSTSASFKAKSLRIRSKKQKQRLQEEERLVEAKGESTVISHGTGQKQFTTLVGDTPSRPIPTTGDLFRAGLRSMKGTRSQGGDEVSKVKKGSHGFGGRVDYAWVSLAQDVDWEGEDVKDNLGAVVKMAMSEGVRPWVGAHGGGEEDGARGGSGGGRIVPFERTPKAFVANGPLSNGGTTVVKIVE